MPFIGFAPAARAPTHGLGTAHLWRKAQLVEAAKVSHCVSIRTPTSAWADRSHDQTTSSTQTADFATREAIRLETANADHAFIFNAANMAVDETDTSERLNLYRSMHRDDAISATLDRLISRRIPFVIASVS
jgi:hypothetical protein